MKRLSRVLVIALVIVVALAGYNITFPAGKSARSNWTFVLTHPTLLLHVVVATGILVMAVIALIRSVRDRDRPSSASTKTGSSPGTDHVVRRWLRFCVTQTSTMRPVSDKAT